MKQRPGGWAATLKDARRRGMHPKDHLFNPFFSVAFQYGPSSGGSIWRCVYDAWIASEYAS